MSALFILSLLIGPVAILFYYVYVRDRWEKEPSKLLWFLMIMGAFGIIPAFVIEVVISGLETNIETIGQAFFMAFCVAGFVEEVTKIFLLYVLVFRESNFNEEYDGIVYGVALALGFAFIENILYVGGAMVSGSGAEAMAIGRAFTAVPMHAATGIILGYHLGLAKFALKPSSRFPIIFKGFMVAFLFHGIYDFFVFSNQAVSIQFWGWGIAGVLFTLYVMWAYCNFCIKRAQELTSKRHIPVITPVPAVQQAIADVRPTKGSYCRMCGNFNSADSKFCIKCGSSLT